MAELFLTQPTQTVYLIQGQNNKGQFALVMAIMAECDQFGFHHYTNDLGYDLFVFGNGLSK